MRYSMFSGGEKNLLCLVLVFPVAGPVDFLATLMKIRNLSGVVRISDANPVVAGQGRKNAKFPGLAANVFINCDDYIRG